MKTKKQLTGTVGSFSSYPNSNGLWNGVATSQANKKRDKWQEENFAKSVCSKGCLLVAFMYLNASNKNPNWM